MSAVRAHIPGDNLVAAATSPVSQHLRGRVRLVRQKWRGRVTRHWRSEVINTTTGAVVWSDDGLHDLPLAHDYCAEQTAIIRAANWYGVGKRSLKEDTSW